MSRRVIFRRNDDRVDWWLVIHTSQICKIELVGGNEFEIRRGNLFDRVHLDPESKCDTPELRRVLEGLVKQIVADLLDTNGKDSTWTFDPGAISTSAWATGWHREPPFRIGGRR